MKLTISPAPTEVNKKSVWKWYIDVDGAVARVENMAAAKTRLKEIVAEALSRGEPVDVLWVDQTKNGWTGRYALVKGEPMLTKQTIVTGDHPELAARCHALPIPPATRDARARVLRAVPGGGAKPPKVDAKPAGPKVTPRPKPTDAKPPKRDQKPPKPAAEGPKVTPRPKPKPPKVQVAPVVRPAPPVSVRTPTPAPRVPTPAPRVPTPAPRMPTPAPRMPTPAPRVPTPAPRMPTPAPAPAPSVIRPRTVPPAAGLSMAELMAQLQSQVAQGLSNL